MKRILIGLGITALIVFALYQYLYRQHRDISEENATTSISAVNLASHFVNSPETATTTYLDKTIIVTGVIKGIDNAGVVLDKGAYAQFKDASDLAALKMQDQLSVKGRCVGYDELFELVKLDQCTIIKK